MSQFATSLLGKRVETEDGVTGEIVAVAPGGFGGLQLTIQTEDGKLADAHSTTVRRVAADTPPASPVAPAAPVGPVTKYGSEPAAGGGVQVPVGNAQVPSSDRRGK